MLDGFEHLRKACFLGRAYDSNAIVSRQQAPEVRMSSSEVCEVLRDMSGYGRAVAAKRSISTIMCYASAHILQRLAWFM